MDNADFDELAGRMEGLARAVLVLAQTMERETNMDGPSLSRDWREAVHPQPATAQLRTAHKTLQELAAALDRDRSRRQARRYQAAMGRLDAQP